MCLLTYLPAGTVPDLDALRTGAELNPDGHGYAVVAGRELVVGKGLDAEVVLAEFDAVRRAHPDGPALFHSRLRTHGRLDVDNCHPFVVGGDPRTVIAHNGILPAVVRPRRGDPRSDTRIAAEDHPPAAGPLHLRRTRLRLQRWMGPTNLMVLLTVDRRYRQNAYLFNEAEGTWDHGIWYSNHGYQPLPTRSAATWRCASCRAPVCEDDLWCPWCEHCWACGDPPLECDCWTPTIRRAMTADRDHYDPSLGARDLAAPE